jgi:Uma2 family endonuclease
MPDPATRGRPLTIEEYLTLEAMSPVRHEYVGGVVYAMTGTTMRHNAIVLNIATLSAWPRAAARAACTRSTSKCAPAIGSTIRTGWWAVFLTTNQPS